MPSYKSFDPNTEVIGHNVLAFVQNAQADEIKTVLEKHDLAEIDPNAWYPQQKWLDVLSDLSEQGGAMFNFVAIGAAIAETAVMPPEAEKLSFEEVIFAINDIYQMQHRNGDAGEITIEKPGKNHLVLNVRVPYPDDLEYGTAFGFARRFLPKGTDFTVLYDDQAPRQSQDGDSTVIHVKWQ